MATWLIQTYQLSFENSGFFVVEIVSSHQERALGNVTSIFTERSETSSINCFGYPGTNKFVNPKFYFWDKNVLSFTLFLQLVIKKILKKRQISKKMRFQTYTWYKIWLHWLQFKNSLTTLRHIFNHLTLIKLRTE